MRLSDGHLVCPGCGSDYLHQRAVAVSGRSEGEEAGSVRTVIVATPSSSGAEVWASEGGEAGRRERQSVRIAFSCEGCGDLHALHIEQHKGQTAVWWEDSPDLRQVN